MPGDKMVFAGIKTKLKLPTSGLTFRILMPMVAPSDSLAGAGTIER
jgi:hypothetical protein